MAKDKRNIDVKEVIWVGSSRRDLRKMPETVRHVFAYGIHLAKLGDKHPDAKQLRGLGKALELVENRAGDTYRAVYTVKFAELVYVLHVFQKKSHKGRKTPKKDLELIKSRLKAARDHYGKHYG